MKSHGVRLVNCDKYCMAHGCATRKNAILNRLELCLKFYLPVVEVEDAAEAAVLAGGAGLMEDPVVSSVRPLTRSVCAVRKKELRHSLSTETSPWYMNSTMPCRSS